MSETYACPVIGCCKVYKRPNALKVHTLMKHGKLEDLPFKCQLEGCSQRYIDERSVLHHANICRTRHPKLRSVTKSRTELDRMTVDEKQQYDQIRKETALALQAEEHRATGGEKVKCSDCEEFFFRCDLLQHHKQAHDNADSTTENQYECKHCGLKFKSKQTRDYHINAKHVDYNSRRHACTHPNCNFRAADSSNLKKHMKACKHDPSRQTTPKIRTVATQTDPLWSQNSEPNESKFDEELFIEPNESKLADSEVMTEIKMPSVQIPDKEQSDQKSDNSFDIPNHTSVSYPQVVDDDSTTISKTVFLTDKSEVYHNAGCRILLDKSGNQRDFRYCIKPVTVDAALSLKKRRCRYCRTIIFAREDAVPIMRGNAVRLGSQISASPASNSTDLWIATSVNVLHKQLDCAKSLDGLVEHASPDDAAKYPHCSKCILAKSVYTPEEVKARKAAKEKRRRETMSDEQRENERKRKKLARSQAKQ